MKLVRSLGNAVVLAALVATGLATSVLAGAPERESFADSFEFAFAECETFDIIGTGSFEIDATVFTNADGSQRLIERLKIAFTLSRSDTGAVVGEGWGNSILLAPLSGLPDGTYVGLRTFETYADGSSIVEVGRIVFDANGDPVFIAGPHPFETTGVDRCEHVDP
jgi:hypothetical protein